MALCILIQSYPRHHLHLLLFRPFGKHSRRIWRNFLRCTDFQTRCYFSTKSSPCLPKTFTSWNKNNFPCLYLAPLGRRFNKSESCFHSSSSLLQQGDSVTNDSEKDIKINQTLPNEDFNEQQFETFDEQNQVDEFAKDSLNNESLVDCVTFEEHAAYLLESSKHSFERNIAGKEEYHSGSLQKTVLLILGW